MNKLELFCVRVFMLLFVSLVPAHSNVQGDSLDIPLSMSVEGQLDTWFGDIATDGNYLFSLHNLSGETDSLNVFDLNDPLNPERLHTYLHHNSVSIYVHEHVYLTSDSGTVTVYHVGSGGELQLVSEYQSVNRITDMTFHHSLAIALPYQYPANEQSTRLELVDTSSPESPDLTGSVMIPGRAKALSPVFSGHYIAAATSAGWKNNGLVIIDISNPAEPVVVDSLTETRDPVDIAVDGNTLILALNGSGRAESLLKFYDIGDPLDVQTVSELVLDDDGFVSDLMMLEGTLFASLSSAGLITSHAWNPDQQTLQSGPSVATDFPMQMIAISDDRSGLYKSARTPDDGVTYTLYSGEQSEGVRIIKIRKPKTGENQVKLTLAITPAKAAEEGCEMSPPPGVYYYDPADEETVELSATPGDGWAFSHWIGPVPNTNPTSITVTEDTEVTAVFMPILTVTGRGERRVLCPDKALETEQLITPVNLMASQADDWTAVNITLKSRGAGDEQKDIENVILKRGQAVVATGSYSRDNGDIQLAFDPPLLIPQASTIRMNLYYQFDYDSAYAQDSVRTFLIETTDLTAMPNHYSPGQILGSAGNDTLMIARVVNSADQGFAEIQPALDHQSTRQGDTVWVCPGEYNENLAIPRPLCLKGMNAAKPVILRHDPEHAQTKLPLIDIRAKEGTVSISGFDFQSGQTAVTSDYAFESAVQLTGNTFAAGFANAITLYQNKPITIGDNRFGFPEHHSIYVHGSEHVNISDNEFDNILELSRDDLGRIYFEETAVYLLDVSKADITGNRSQTDFGIWGLRVKNIKIRDNHVDQMQRWGGYIVLNDTELANITDNSNFRVLLNKTLMSKIEGNTVNWRRRDGDELAMFDLANVVFLDVEHNNLRSAERGTFIGIKVSSGVDLVKLRHNKISNFNNGIACLGTFNMHNHKYGNKILDNRILNCGYAIYMYSSDNWSVDGNVLLENHTGLLLERSDDIRLGINIIRNSSGFLTGVHLDQSSARIENNHIAGNHGSGIALKNASDALIRGNNIVDNNPGVTNSQPDSVSANDNWWGSAGGPGADDISGAVRVQTWLPQPVNAVLSIPQDTLFLRDQRDSVAVLVNRFDGQADELNLTITDATGWMSSTADTALVLPDTGAAVCRIKFDGRQGGSGGWIKLNAVMQSDALSARDSLYVMSYTPVPAYITLTPDTVILTPGDSVRFSALCTDQYGQQQRTPFDWEAEGGSIDETGLFTAGEQSGEYQVQVSVPDQSVQQSAVVIISSDVRVEQPDEIPRDYCLYPASPNPFNPVTTLSFSVPEPARVTLHIYNIRGQRLWSHQPKVEAGRHRLRWQARDDQGRPLSSGLYILELRAGDSFRQVQKLLLVR